MNKKAFTLTEMLIVLIIISGLSVLLIPNIANSKSSIDSKTCDAYIRLVDSQIQAYKLDHDTDPASIDTLVTENYIQSNSCPSGELLEINAEQKTQIKVTTP